jgi:hypothetical protein
MRALKLNHKHLDPTNYLLITKNKKEDCLLENKYTPCRSIEQHQS